MERVERCYLCGGKSFCALPARGRCFSGETVNLCVTCGLVFLSPRLCEEDLNTFYESEYSRLFRGDEYPTPEIIAQRLPAARSRFKFVEGRLGDRNWQVLEIGCSCGLFLDLLKKNGFRSLAGMDLSRGFTQYARNELHLDVATGSFPKALTRPGPFDLICFFHTFEHVSDPNLFLSNIRDLLRSDGIIYVEVPDISVKLAQRYFFQSYFEKGHLFDYSRATLRMIFAKHGFSELDHEYEMAPKKKHHLRALFRRDESPSLPDFASADVARLRDEMLRKLRYGLARRIMRRILLAAGKWEE
ncbi:MAG: class I SAM-dependent methyltransferase [bacterium]